MSPASSARETALDAIADLAVHGVVAALTPAPAQGAPTGAVRVGFVEPEDSGADLPAFLATARRLCAQMRQPCPSAPLLVLIERFERLPDAPTIVALPRPDPAPFLERLTAKTRAEALARIARRADARLLALGRVDDAERAIDEHFVFPAIACALERALGTRAGRLRFARPTILDAAPDFALTLPRFDPRAPLGANLFALAMRRLHHANPKGAARRWFDVNPLSLGRRVAAAGDLPRAAGEAMIAALQMDFLSP